MELAVVAALQWTVSAWGRIEMLIQPLSLLNSVPRCLGMQGLRGLPAPKA